MIYKELLEIIKIEKINQTGTLDFQLHFYSDYNIKNNHLNNLLKEVAKLEYLRILRIGHLAIITDISYLTNLKNLRELDLTKNSISDISPIANLKKLEVLDLSYNKISDINPLKNLKNLRELDLTKNSISDISPIANLKKLQWLDLGYNFIKDISPLPNFKNSQILDINLRNNLITNIPKLPSTIAINISENDIKKITLYNYLHQTNNYISLMSIAKELKKNAVKNQEYERAADLRDQESEFLRTIKLGKLNLDNNDYKKYKKFIDKEYYEYIKLNSIEHPPLEIIHQGKNAILKYFEDLKIYGEDELFEAKLLILGEGESGKTTLVWKLKDKDSRMPEKETERTEGIDIHPLFITNKLKDKKKFQVNIWDFGGQEIYHSTHQFFLTKRSLYIIVNNTRSNLTDFNDWLQRISILTDNSPVIILQNQVADSLTDLDLKGLQSKFSNIIGMYDVDLSNMDDGRFDKLKEAIEFHIQQLDHVGNPLPKKWVIIRKILNEREKEDAYISKTEFYKICTNNEIIEKEAIKRLSSFLHDLGVFLHFQDDSVLKHLVILKNNWATKGVYKILDDKKIQNKKGHFSYQEIEALFQGTDFDDMHDELLSLMDKFELCYQIPGIKEKKYVSPQLLSKEKPDYKWDNQKNLILYYNYEFMPKGLLSRLIVRLYRYIKNIDSMAWRMGCVFTYENTDAQVVETYGTKKIEIRIQGKNCIKLATLITSEINALNDTFENIKVSKMIPCNCSECFSNKNSHYYKYEDLMRRKEKGRKRTIECVISEDDINYLELLDGIFDKKYEVTFNKAKIKDTVRKLAANPDLEEAIREFEKLDRDNSIMLANRWNHINLQNTEGKITQEVFHTECTKIGNDLLTFLSLG